MNDIKRHINVEFDDDDTLIEGYIAAAEGAVENALNCPLAEYAVDDKLPAPIIHAVRLHVAKLYEYREGVTHGKIQDVPFTFSFLIAPYIKLS